MWYNRNGGNARNATTGWYQGCGGQIGKKHNNNWDTLINPLASTRSVSLAQMLILKQPSFACMHDSFEL